MSKDIQSPALLGNEISYTGYWKCPLCKRGRVILQAGKTQSPPLCLRYPRKHGMMELLRIDLPAWDRLHVSALMSWLPKEQPPVGGEK